MTLLLKQLDIHGFKSFAIPTTFVFDRGITAIIGPNGSGKSNVAEALRWVLGEQGYSNLRSRKTEDVIFAGSDKRAQLSMAEVVLTLDNRDGELPLPYSEITITRRAFRSGESQYLINGSRVRLKDIQQLVAPLGQSYTIIGQGLVDAALSQRPEERRGLFEHAAGISGLRLRANEAERSLAESSANAQRLRDILSELEPRVRSLERSARLAREYGTVRERLLDLQRRYYGRLWADSLARLSAARQSLREAEESHEEAERLHEQASRRLSARRSEERRLAEEQRLLAEAVLDNEREIANTRHQRDLLVARIRSTSERLADLDARIEEHKQEHAEAIAEIERSRSEIGELKERIGRLEAELVRHDEVAEAARRRRSELRATLDAADQRIIAISRGLAEIDGSRNAVAERRASLAADREQITRQVTSNRERADEARLKLGEFDQRAAELQAAIEIATNSIAETSSEITAATGTVDQARSALHEAERELARLQTRLDALERSHASGEGLYAGVRAVLRAINRRELELPGLVGTLAETIEVPGDLETAIEVALGGHLQDLIVDTWSDAQTAIGYLKRNNAGRATFQPLDTVRPGRRLALNVRDNGLRGIAADLITYPATIAAVIDQLLGRTLVVADLDASRRILGAAPGWTLVTLSGEITRPSGSVTGGGRVAEAGLLARERERRSLPTTIARKNAERSELQATIEREQAAIREFERRRQAARSELDTLQRRFRELQAERTRTQQVLDDAEAAIAQSGTRQASLDQRERELAEAAAALDQRQAALEDERQTLQRKREEAAAGLASEPDDIDAAAASLRVEIAQLRERLRTSEHAARRAAERASAALKASETRTAERDRLTQAAAEDEQTRVKLDEQLESLLRQADQRRAAVEPVVNQQAEIAEELVKAERVLHQAAEALREAERERDRASLQLARVQDEQVFVVERIRNDLELDDPAELESVADDDVPDEGEINRLRERLRRMSNVGEDVLEQHETESQRLAFLTGQLADVDQASERLRRVLSDLNGRMAVQFNDTFRDVAVAFERTFTRLFGGGTAKLVMNDGEDGVAGIDIVAQPPGKRLQNLTALSGGERALTAVALLIAIQRVNPSPFCLLDEVDAALDESNVVRFRDELRELSGGTQYVVITHNRGTIEGADTLYGVTMGDDGVSRVLSLRLDEAIRAVESYETAESATTD